MIEEGKKEGWGQVQALKGRTASCGLVGVGCHNGSAAIVEVNCETDFVAKNEQFQSLVKEVTQACLNYAQSSPSLNKTIVSEKLYNPENFI